MFNWYMLLIHDTYALTSLFGTKTRDTLKPLIVLLIYISSSINFILKSVVIFELKQISYWIDINVVTSLAFVNQLFLAV